MTEAPPSDHRRTLSAVVAPHAPSSSSGPRRCLCPGFPGQAADTPGSEAGSLAGGQDTPAHNSQDDEDGVHSVLDNAHLASSGASHARLELPRSACDVARVVHDADVHTPLGQHVLRGLHGRHEPRERHEPRGLRAPRELREPRGPLEQRGLHVLVHVHAKCQEALDAPAPCSHAHRWQVGSVPLHAIQLQSAYLSSLMKQSQTCRT